MTISFYFVLLGSFNMFFRVDIHNIFPMFKIDKLTLSVSGVVKWMHTQLTPLTRLKQREAFLADYLGEEIVVAVIMNACSDVCTS